MYGLSGVCGQLELAATQLKTERQKLEHIARVVGVAAVVGK